MWELLSLNLNCCGNYWAAVCNPAPGVREIIQFFLGSFQTLNYIIRLFLDLLNAGKCLSYSVFIHLDLHS
uniref:Uncharacterized protein n=1 Tax=Anguilla anguilla TaxID=7936 RepID=A0A0E9WKZ3_ANGAN